MQPRFITDLASFTAIVRPGVTPESVCLEFKKLLALNQREENVRIKKALELCRDVSQFANTEGGCLVIGVAETRDAGGGVTVAGAIVGVDDVEVLRQQIEDALALYLVPSTFTRDIVPVGLPDGRTILVINIPASERPVVVWNGREKWSQCYRRSSFRKVALNPTEFEAFMMDTARGMRLRLARMKDEGPLAVKIHSEVWEEWGNNWTGRSDPELTMVREYTSSLIAIGEHALTLELVLRSGRAPLNVPYGFLEEVWRDASGVVTLSLTRKIVVDRQGHLYLERRLHGA